MSLECCVCFSFFVFKQKTAYEMRISDWSSDVCSSDLDDHLWAGERRRTSAANWRQPLKWNRDAEKAGKCARVFCASLADVFDNQVPEDWRDGLWSLIRRTPHLDWLLLTKRPQNIAMMLPGDWKETRIPYQIGRAHV